MCHFYETNELTTKYLRAKNSKQVSLFHIASASICDHLVSLNHVCNQMIKWLSHQPHCSGAPFQRSILLLHLYFQVISFMASLSSFIGQYQSHSSLISTLKVPLVSSVISNRPNKLPFLDLRFIHFPPSQPDGSENVPLECLKTLWLSSCNCFYSSVPLF